MCSPAQPKLKISHLQAAVDGSRKNYLPLRKVKVLSRQLYEYAVINEIIPKEHNFVEFVNISRAGNPNASARTPFKKVS